MPSAQPGLSMLDALRARSAAARAAVSPARAAGAVDPRAIDRALLAAFRWLDEAFLHLDVIRPVVAHRFELPGVLTIASPRYDRGVASCRRSLFGGFDLIERIELFYRLTRDEPVRVEVPPGAAAAMEDRLRCAQFEFQYRIEHEPGRRARRGVFTVAQAVMAAIRLVPDYDRGVVAAELRNVDRLEPVTLEFAPAAIDEPALEDLVRLVLGEKSGFLKRAPLAGVGAASLPSPGPGPRSAAAALSPSRYRAGSE